MLNYKKLNIEDKCYVLLTSSSNPSILIPIRGIIKEIKYDVDNPMFKIEIDYIYDNWPFLKENFFNNTYTYSFTDRPRPCKLTTSKVKNKDQLMWKLQESDEKDRYYIVIESLMSFTSKSEMFEAFEEIQNFFIQRKLREVMEFQTRGLYHGKFRIDTIKEWFIRGKDLIDEDMSDEEYKKLMYNF